MRHRAVPFATAGAALLLLAGCVSMSLEDAAPVSAFDEPELPAEVEARLADAEAVQPDDGSPAFANPGSYPNLNVVPTPAAPQITGSQRRAGTAELRATRDRLEREAGGQAVSDSAAELRRIARRHADDTLKEIEGE